MRAYHSVNMATAPNPVVQPRKDVSARLRGFGRLGLLAILAILL
jgi:hypothetical protein